MSCDSPGRAVSCCAAQITVSTQSLPRAVAYLQAEVYWLNNRKGIQVFTQVKILLQSDEIVLHFSEDLFLFVQIFEKQMLSIWDVNK